jgi:enoyl-CoA hydratase
MFESDALRCVIDRHIAEISMTRPGHLNRFDESVHADFVEVIGRLGRADQVRAAVIGSTGRAFSAGGDFEAIKKLHDDSRFRLRTGSEALRLLEGLTGLAFPVIAAVQGPAIGLGATIALACDCVVAGPDAVFADPHVEVGLAAGDGGCLVWPQAIGMSRAKRYLLTGDRLSAAKAYQFGLVTDLVSTTDEVLPAARTLASRIAALPPLAVQGTKRALNNIVRNRAAEVTDLAYAYEAQTAVSDDLLEALNALEQRRPGRYAGR